MNNYSNLPGINTQIPVYIKTSCIGFPNYTVIVNGQTYTNNIINHNVNLLDKIKIEIELRNKTYTLEYETAIIIEQLSIDNIDLIPRYDYLAEYINDHNNNNPTSYLGFNGKWSLTIDRPFYQWLHQAQNQGWLLD